MGVEILVLSMVNTGKVKTLTFPILCITIKLLQFKPTNAHNYIKVTILQHTISYMFFASSGSTHFCKTVADDGPVRPKTRKSWCVVIL